MALTPAGLTDRIPLLNGRESHGNPLSNPEITIDIV